MVPFLLAAQRADCALFDKRTPERKQADNRICQIMFSHEAPSGFSESSAMPDMKWNLLVTYTRVQEWKERDALQVP